jgi:hypothetical protein
MLTLNILASLFPNFKQSYSQAHKLHSQHFTSECHLRTQELRQKSFSIIVIASMLQS